MYNNLFRVPFRDNNPKKIRTTLPTVGQFSAAAEPRPQDYHQNQFSEKKGVQRKGFLSSLSVHFGVCEKTL